jgi:hypothetical protein
MSVISDKVEVNNSSSISDILIGKPDGKKPFGR